MSIGAAASFMITGPATKITNLGAVKIVLGDRSVCRWTEVKSKEMYYIMTACKVRESFIKLRDSFLI